MPKKKPSVLFQKRMDAIGENERKHFQLVGKDIVCRACSKKFSLWGKKFLLTQHLRTAFHKKSVQFVKLNPTAAERQNEGGHPFHRWIREIDEEERKNFQLDGNCIICNACFRRFEWDKKFLLTQHVETAKHKKCVQLKNAAAVKLKMLAKDNKETPGSKLCVFCATGIGETNNINGIPDDRVAEDDAAGYNILKEETFLRGMLVICKKLQVDSKFATRKKWSEASDDGGGVCFAKNVCCQKCYGDLAKLAALRQQINELQVLMKQLITAFERLVVWSHETGGGEDQSEFCFKSKTCLKFRQQILKNHQNSVLAHQATSTTRDDQKIFQDSGDTTLSQPITALPVPISTKQHSEIEIKVEQFNDLHFSSTIDQEDCDVAENINFENDFDHHDDDIISSPPIYEAEQEWHSVKLTRKRKKSNAEAPVINRASEESTLMQEKPSYPIVRRTDYDEPVQKPEKRKRKRYRKIKIITEESSSDEKDDDDDEYMPDNFESENESDNNDKKKETKTKRASSRNRSSRNAKLDKTKKIPRKILKGDGPPFRPIYVLNSDTGSLMFLNVKFQRTQDSLLCQHPHCSHEIPIVGYFTDQTALRIMRFHIQQFHRGGKNQFKPVTYTDPYHFCCHCEIQLGSRVELIKHREKHHKNFVMPPAMCDVCGKVMSDDKLAEHFISHKSVEEKQMVAQEPWQRGRQAYMLLPQHFPCDQCDRVFSNSTELRLHRERHNPWEKRKAFICSYCGHRFVSTITMENHIKRVHFKADEPAPIQCRICGKKFMRFYRYAYEEHLRSHTGDKPFQCEQCGKSFIAKRYLTAHTKMHIDAKLPCEFCGQIYKGIKYLKRHHLKHHPDLVKRVKEYKKASTEDFIGPKLMYPCEPCGHVFMYKSVLVAHLKRLHKMELEKSEDYPTMFTWEDSVNIK